MLSPVGLMVKSGTSSLAVTVHNFNFEDRLVPKSTNILEPAQGVSGRCSSKSDSCPNLIRALLVNPTAIRARAKLSLDIQLAFKSEPSLAQSQPSSELFV